MRTNIEIDDKLMKDALRLTKLKTKKEVINRALKEYVKYQKRLQLSALQGEVTWIGDLNKMRKNG